MAYKALYRTYRPNNFDEVYGQKHIVQTLKNAITQNKIAHAYLFCGPRGTGKTSIAKIFAKTINCTDDTHRPCCKCDNCLAVANGTHPDIVEIDAASNNGVEEVRNLIEKVKYAPLKGKYKIYIIDEVHMMSTGAFNALLKTIEEPPAHVIFIMATTEPHKVLPTIISRCQRFDFTKIPQSEIEARIHDVIRNEKLTCSDEVIRIIAQLADGGMRDALSILDQCIAYASDHIEVHHINEIYGITTIKEKLSLIDCIVKKDAQTLLDMVEKFIEKGIDMKRLTVDLIDILKESIIYEYTKDESLLSILNGDEVSELISNLKRAHRFDMIHILMETYDKYRSAANVGTYFEVCLLQMLDEKAEVTPVVASAQSTQTVISSPLPQPVLPKKVDDNVSRETLKPKNTIIEEDDHKPSETNKGYEIPLEEDETIQIPTKPTIENKPKEIKPLDTEFVLSLLAGANKPEKKEDMENFTRINEFLIDLKWAKSASLLRNSTIVASGSNYLVISVDNQAEANEINEIDSKNEFNAFIIELLNKNKKVYAITKQQQVAIIQEFKVRMANNTLPAPVMIETVHMKQKEVKEVTQEEAILELFGKDNIVITEE